ncbi:NAD-dependent epimerase/dehydratase family protein [Actinomyces urogenitalis]|uniref:NAD-dependent epimerase/dehydratase family protein n=1 Tax=Actinomyces urogenitalis TaxID=103621 RepID=UPI00242CACCE|nr:NAD-dependent epimerase/dehydratase family protein [Actinomyces urogenitalis]MCI7455843.1 NAD-dependent epimerase/dehydratase family protein [Actinomyces urogenitalis]
MTDLAGKRVLVTGGTGFLGGHICDALRARGAQPIAAGSRDWDLTRQDAVREMFAATRPQIVVHAAAAVGGIGANVADPARFLVANNLMGLFVLEEARLSGVEKFVMTSTTCAYPDRAPMPLTETDLWDGKPTPATGPYGIAKRTLHEACRLYCEQYGMKAAVVILTNLYGPRDHFIGPGTHVLPALIRRYCEAKKSGLPEITNWGTGTATREFLYVTDGAEAFVRAIERDVPPEPINVGTGVETSISEVAELVQEAVGYTGVVRWDATRPEGVRRRVLNVEKQQALLGYAPAVSLDEGVRRTVAWYKENIE